ERTCDGKTHHGGSFRSVKTAVLYTIQRARQQPATNQLRNGDDGATAHGKRDPHENKRPVSSRMAFVFARVSLPIAAERAAYPPPKRVVERGLRLASVAPCDLFLCQLYASSLKPDR